MLEYITARLKIPVIFPHSPEKSKKQTGRSGNVIKLRPEPRRWGADFHRLPLNAVGLFYTLPFSQAAFYELIVKNPAVCFTFCEL